MKLWAYVKSAKNLGAWEGYGDEYGKIELAGVSETVQIMVDTKTQQDKAEEQYKDDNAKKKEAKKKIEEQGKRTGQLHSEATANEVKLLDETYEQKYGEIIDAHKATKTYLKANGKTIALYKKDMAVLKEQMKNAEVLGLDEEWQKQQIEKIKTKNAERVAELQEKKSAAEAKMQEADDQKEAAEAIEKAVPDFKKWQPASAKLDKATAAVFYTEDEIANLDKPKVKDKEEVKAESVVNEEEEKKDEDKKYVKDLSRLTRNPKLAKEISELPTDDAKKERIKQALQEFEKGLEVYNAANLEVKTIEQKVGSAIDKMAEDERPKGSSGFIKWKDIDLAKLEEETELDKTVRTKIGMTEQEDTKPGDILKLAAGKTKNPEVEKIEKEIKDLQSQKSAHQEEIKKLKGEETEKKPEEKEDDKVVEIKKLKNDIDTFKAQKSELQTRIKALQAA